MKKSKNTDKIIADYNKQLAKDKTSIALEKQLNKILKEISTIHNK